MSTQTESMGIFLQYQIMTSRNLFQQLKEIKSWLKKFFSVHQVERIKNKVAMAQYLSKYLFEKYEDEAIFAASWCGLPVSTSMKP